MPRISTFTVSGYRSIGERVDIAFPTDTPVVLIGENNAGKSNIVRAIDLLLGQGWPGTHEPDDNEFYNRDRQSTIHIAAHFDAAALLADYHTRIQWKYDGTSAEGPYFRVSPGNGGYADGFVSNAIRSTCSCAVIEAERNLTYHLSYASKWTLLSRLMHRFHKAMLDEPGKREELLGLFNQVREKFNSIQQFGEFKVVLQERLGEFAQTMTHRLEVDFEAYNPVNFFHALRLHAAEGDERRTLQEMGTGEQQILALSFAYAYATTFHEGVFLVVEEPESHLHPLAQQWLASRLTALCNSGLQVVITTHSAHFLNMLALEGLVLVRKRLGQTTVRQMTRQELRDACVMTGAPADRTTTANILEFYQSQATPEILEGFFSKLVVLSKVRPRVLASPRYLLRQNSRTLSAALR